MYLTLRGTPIMYYGEEIGMAEQRSDAQRGREGPDWEAGLAEEEGPRRRAHADAMERHSECRIHHRAFRGCRFR